MTKNNKEPIFRFRWKNFRSLKDTKWIDVKPLTIFIGSNNSGKTSLFYPLLIMKQTIESTDLKLPLKTKGKYVKVGDYRNLIYNHDTDRNLIFEICRNYYPCKKKNESKNADEHSSEIVSLTFQNGEKDDCELKSFEINQVECKAFLKRKLEDSGNYSFEFSNPTNEKVDETILDTISNDHPKHFLFDGMTIFRSLIHRTEDKDNAEIINEINITGFAASIFGILGRSSSSFESLLEKIDYIGPLRQHPKRYYESIGEKPYSVGSFGEYTSDILLQMKKEDKLKSINDWLHEFKFTGEIDCNEFQQGIFSIEWNDKLSGNKTNIADTGFGASQILPLITQGLWMDENRFLIAEQPEIHLNPKLQSKLADFFVNLVKSKKRVIIETHSEHLLLRLRTLIADNKIDASKIALYFVEKVDGETLVENIQISENGHIEADSWPKDFFEESLKESFNLAITQSQRKKQNET